MNSSKKRFLLIKATIHGCVNPTTFLCMWHWMQICFNWGRSHCIKFIIISNSCSLFVLGRWQHPLLWDCRWCPICSLSKSVPVRCTTERPWYVMLGVVSLFLKFNAWSLQHYRPNQSPVILNHISIQPTIGGGWSGGGILYCDSVKHSMALTSVSTPLSSKFIDWISRRVPNIPDLTLDLIVWPCGNL